MPVFKPKPEINPDDFTVLLGADGKHAKELETHEWDHRKFPVHNWTRKAQEIKWGINVIEEHEYSVNILVRASYNMIFEVECNGNKIRHNIDKISGKPKYQWTREKFTDNLFLAEGIQTITLRVIEVNNCAQFNLSFLSIELVKPEVEERLYKEALSMRADTGWLQNARYGLMFHWTNQTYPRHGTKKPYEQAVEDFDLDLFVKQVIASGAGFVVITTTHAFQYFPGPNDALDRIISGRTSKRDLIGEMADELEKYNIKLFLYYHLGAIDDNKWLQKSGFWDPDTNRFFNNWIKIITEVGHRYGKKLAGWWFDDGTANYYYRSSFWKQLDEAAKAGYNERLVGFNPWIWPIPTQFMDYHVGEEYRDPSGNGWLPVNGGGKYIDGAMKGLQACATLITENNWVHKQKDTFIGEPGWSYEELKDYIWQFIQRKNVPIFNLEIYQNGKMSEKSINLFKKVYKSIRKEQDTNRK